MLGANIPTSEQQTSVALRMAALLAPRGGALEILSALTDQPLPPLGSTRVQVRIGREGPTHAQGQLFVL